MKNLVLLIALILIIPAEASSQGILDKAKSGLKKAEKLEKKSKKIIKTSSPKIPTGKKSEGVAKDSSSNKKSEKTIKASSQNVPDCVKSWPYKVKSIEKELEKINPSHASSTEFKYYESGVERSINTAEKSLNICSEKKPDYDFSSYRNDIKQFRNKFNEYSKGVNYVKELEKVAYTLSKVLFNIENYFPAVGIDTIKLADVNRILQSNPVENSEIYRVIKKYKQVKKKLEDPNKLADVYTKVDRFYDDSDKVRVIENISRVESSLSYLKQEIYPESKTLETGLSYTRRLLNKQKTIQKSKLGSIAVSDFHLNNVNKIFFTSNLGLDPAKATAADFKTNFTAGESIKGIAYLDNQIGKLIGMSNMPQFDLKSGNKNNDFVVEAYTRADQAKSYVEFYIVQTGNEYKATPGRPATTAIAMDFLGELPPRSQKIDVKLEKFDRSESGTEKFREVKGSFNFDASNEAGLTKMEASKVEIRDKHLANVPLPKSGQHNTAYEAQLVKLFNSIGWEEKFTKTIIESSSWAYKKNYRGEVVGRTLRVYMFSTKKDGCMYQEFTVIQDKVGSGWGSFKQLSTGTQTDISCKKVK